MAIEKVIDIKVQGNADQAVGSLRSQLREAQADVAKLSDKFGATSAEAVKAAQKAAELKDRIGDAKALTDAFNPDAKFKALTSSLAGVAGGFAAVQGGMALFGVQSKEVEATLLKVQSAMALSQGIQAVGESVDSFKQLSAVIQNSTAFQKINSAATTVAAVIQKVFTGAVNTTSVAFNSLKAAIVATGIGALVVLIGTAIQYMNSMGDETEEAARKQDLLNDAVDRSNAALSEELKGIDYVNKARRSRAIIAGQSESEIVKIEKEANQERLAALKSNQERQLELLNNSKGDRKKQQEAVVKADKEYYDEINRQELDRLQKQADNSVKAREKQDSEAAKAKEKRISDYEKDKAETIKQSEEIDELTYNFRKGAVQKIALINTESINAKLKEDQLLVEKEKENSDARVKLAEAEAAAKEALIAKTASVLSRGADLLGKNTAAGKAMAIAAATINTYQGITAELATKTVTPFEIGLKIANVAIIAATGFKAVKDIISVKVPGGGGGGAAPSGGGMAGGAGATAPQFNVVGSTGVNQLAGVMGAQQQTPVQAYVVANNVTTAQSLDRNIIQSATLGG
jgi:hypothetical protein